MCSIPGQKQQGSRSDQRTICSHRYYYYLYAFQNILKSASVLHTVDGAVSMADLPWDIEGLGSLRLVPCAKHAMAARFVELLDALCFISKVWLKALLSNRANIVTYFMSCIYIYLYLHYLFI